MTESSFAGKPVSSPFETWKVPWNRPLCALVVCAVDSVRRLVDAGRRPDCDGVRDLQLFGVFLCVTLHEYGHAMAARAFGIGTADITLLPIGGVARLHRMPRIPWQELIVAVAGPAVNVVIAISLLIGFAVFLDRSVLSSLAASFQAGFTDAPIDDEVVEQVNTIFLSPSFTGFAVLMLVVNIMLVLFNMIPAFPMDGGRVFRSLMAMVFDYRQGNLDRFTSRSGVRLLMAMGAITLDPSNPIPLLIAVFIGYAGALRSATCSR